VAQFQEWLYPEANKPAATSQRVVWHPHPENKPQTLAYRLADMVDVLGYGGAAGGGKTDLMLGLSFTKHQITKIFRREAAQLEDMIDRARELVGDALNLKGSGRLPDGRRISLLGVKDEGDVNKHKGRPADLFGFDEATEFTEQQVRFLLGWNRTTKPGQHCLAVLCFNPPTTAEGRWVIKYFAPWLDQTHPNPAKPGEIRYFATLPGGKEIERPDGKTFDFTDPESKRVEHITPQSRTFIPAKAGDNPYFDERYIATLQALPEPLRSQLLYADFNAGIKDDPWQIIPTSWVQAAQARWLKLGGKPPVDATLDAVGCDVARGGDNQTILAPRWGTFFGAVDKHPGITTPDGPAVAALVAAKVGDSLAHVMIDVGGIGSSAYDSIARSKIMVFAINNASSPTAGYTDRSGKLKMANVRSEYYWRLREALEPGKGDDLALPPDPELLGDLTAPRWELTTRGVIVEEKKAVSKRIGRSPDVGDAVILAHAPPPRGFELPTVGPQSLGTRKNPFQMGRR
jgi:hypothetical protein